MKNVEGKRLLVIAGFVWCTAGFNVLRTGIANMVSHSHGLVLPLVFSAIIYYLFMKFVFLRLVNKHSRRILTYCNKKINIFKFMDRKGYFIFFFMIVLGILFQRYHLVHLLYLGCFYTGLGAALFSGGVIFFKRYSNP